MGFRRHRGEISSLIWPQERTKKDRSGFPTSIQKQTERGVVASTWRKRLGIADWSSIKIWGRIINSISWYEVKTVATASEWERRQLDAQLPAKLPLCIFNDPVSTQIFYTRILYPVRGGLTRSLEVSSVKSNAISLQQFWRRADVRNGRTFWSRLFKFDFVRYI